MTVRHPLEGFQGDAFVDAEGEGRAPTERELIDARFAPGTPAEHRYAVLYQGEYETPWDGTAVAVRLHARALASTGIPVWLTSFSHVVINEYGYADPVHQVGLPRDVELEVGHLRRLSATSHIPVIRHAVLRSAEHAQGVLIPRGVVAASEDIEAVTALRKAVAQCTILYTVWERDRIDREMVRVLSRSGELWVPCLQNATMLINSGVPRDIVRVMPHPYDPEDDICKCARLKQAEYAPSGWRLFYSIGRWEPRKGYAELIRAFLKAFTPKDKVVLTIKHNGGQWPGYPSPEEAIRQGLAEAPQWSAEAAEPRIVLLSGRGPRSGILELHCRNNIYVSSSHGEAWCLPAYEATLAGNALVAVPYGGVVDFMGNDAVTVMPSGMEPVPESYRWPAGTEWCGYTVVALAEALAAAKPPLRFDLPSHMERYRMDRVGRDMLARVLAITEKNQPAAAEYFRNKVTRSL